MVFRSGAGVSQIAEGLKQAGLIRSETLFVLVAKVTGAGRHLKAGEYDFTSRASMAQILDAIREGRVVRHFVTVPEGVTSDQVMDILAKSDILTGVAPAPPEGAVLPETYEVERGEDRAAVLQRMMDARDRVLAQLWAHRRADLLPLHPRRCGDLGLHRRKGNRQARRAAADRRGVHQPPGRTVMKLQSDPTVIYGLTGGRPRGHGLRVLRTGVPDALQHLM